MTFLTVRQPPNPTPGFPSPCEISQDVVVLQVHDGQNLTLSGVTMRSDRLPTLDASITVMGGGSIVINSTYVSGGVNRVSISSNKLDVPVGSSPHQARSNNKLLLPDLFELALA